MLIDSIITDKLINWGKLTEQKTSKQKSTIISYLTLMSVVFRDLTLISQSKSSKELLIPSMSEVYSSKIGNFPNANWSRCLDLLESTIENIKRNINPELELYSFLIDINDCLKGKLINTFAS